MERVMERVMKRVMIGALGSERNCDWYSRVQLGKAGLTTGAPEFRYARGIVIFRNPGIAEG